MVALGKGQDQPLLLFLFRKPPAANAGVLRKFYNQIYLAIIVQQFIEKMLQILYLFFHGPTLHILQNLTK
jgi:hypothetical protein